MKLNFLFCCCPVLEDEEKKTPKKKRSGKKGKKKREAQPASASEDLFLTIDCAGEPISTNGCAEEPVSSLTVDWPEESGSTIDSRQVPVSTVDCPEELFSSTTIVSPEDPVLYIDCAEAPVITIDCADEPAFYIDCTDNPVSTLTIDSPEESVLTIDSPEEPVLTIDSPEEPVPTIDSPEVPVPTIDSPEVPVLTIDSPEEPVPTIDSPEVPVPTIDSPEVPVPTIDSPEVPVPTIDSPEEPVPTIDRPEVPVPTIDSPEVPVPTIDNPEVPVPTFDSPEVPVPTFDNPEVPVPTFDSPEVPVPTIDSPEVPVPTIDSPEVPVPTIDSPEVPVPTIDSSEVPVPTIDSPEEPALTIDSPEVPVPTIDSPEVPVPTIDSPEEPVTTIDSPEVPVPTIDSPEVPVPTIDSPEEPVPTIVSPEVPVLTIDSPEEPAFVDQEAKMKKKKWFLKKGKKGMKVSPLPAEKMTLTVYATEKKEKVKRKWFKKGKKGMKPTSVSAESLPVTCSEGPGLTISCVEQPALPIAFGDTSAAIAIGSVQKSAVPLDFRDCTVHDAEQQQRLEGLKKLQEDQSGQGETQTSRMNHAALGFPNIGNTCYMNATLQSLFSLQTFILDIRREEGCWRPDSTPCLQKCLADLYSARASSGREQKISLLKTLKRTIAAEFCDFSGDEQQDAQEFLSVLLCQLKEEGALLRMQMALPPSSSPVEENFEFNLLCSRTCLRCGTEVCRTESYNSLFVDLVPGGSVQDCLDLYFKVCEIECQCQWCPGQLASVEQTFQSVPRVLVVQLKRFSWSSRGSLVKLHDQLHISPQLSLQAYSRADVRLPKMPKAHLTHGDCVDTSPSLGGAVSFTADKKSSVERSPDKSTDQDSLAVNEYRITSVVSHIGSNRQRGHYICEGADDSTTWLSFDDERVKRVDLETVLNQRAKSAYLLFYEYRDPDGLR